MGDRERSLLGLDTLLCYSASVKLTGKNVADSQQVSHENVTGRNKRGSFICDLSFI